MPLTFDQQLETLADVVTSARTRRLISHKYRCSDWMVDETVHCLWKRLSKIAKNRREGDDTARLAMNRDQLPMDRRDFEGLSNYYIRYAFSDVIKERNKWGRDRLVPTDPTDHYPQTEPEEAFADCTERDRLGRLLETLRNRPDLASKRNLTVALGAALAAGSEWAIAAEVPSFGPDNHLFGLVDPIQFDLGLGFDPSGSGFVKLSPETVRRRLSRSRAAIRKELSLLESRGQNNE